MRRYTQASALAITLLIPTFATAQDVSVSAGATLTSRYLFNGLEHWCCASALVGSRISGFLCGDMGV